MRSRGRLHKTKLPTFTEWLEARGWVKQDTKDYYEVLRMRWPNDKSVEPLLVHKKMEVKEHYTTWGISETLLSQWFRETKT